MTRLVALNAPSLDAERSGEMNKLRKRAKRKRVGHGWEDDDVTGMTAATAAAQVAPGCRAQSAAGTAPAAVAVAGTAAVAVAVVFLVIIVAVVVVVVAAVLSSGGGSQCQGHRQGERHRRRLRWQCFLDRASAATASADQVLHTRGGKVHWERYPPG